MVLLWWVVMAPRLTFPQPPGATLPGTAAWSPEGACGECQPPYQVLPRAACGHSSSPGHRKRHALTIQLVGQRLDLSSENPPGRRTAG